MAVIRRRRIRFSETLTSSHLISAVMALRVPRVVMRTTMSGARRRILLPAW